jgi:hypothetical protein
LSTAICSGVTRATAVVRMTLMPGRGRRFGGASPAGDMPAKLEAVATRPMRPFGVSKKAALRAACRLRPDPAWTTPRSFRVWAVAIMPAVPKSAAWLLATDIMSMPAAL